MKYFSIILILSFTTRIIFAQIPKVACGTIQRLDKFPSKFVDARNVDIWLPDGYRKDKKYAVVYMHDGQALYDSTTTWNRQEWGVDEVLCKLTNLNLVKDCIVVGIWNNGVKRHPEYFPQKAFYSMTLPDQQKILAVGKDKGTPLLGNGPIADNYLKFLVSELKPYIDQHFNTLSGQKNTFIMGSSMGGLISMYAICEYPKVFGGAACMSTHWPGIFTTTDNPIPAALLQYLKTHLPSPKDHKLYFDFGSETLDALYKPYQSKADSIIRSQGYTKTNWLTMEFTGADHSERSWNKRLDIPMLFLLGK